MTTIKHQPIHRFRLGAITLSIWQNTDRQGRAFFTTSISRSYRTQNGGWQNSSSLRAVDLPVVRTLTEQASHWLAQQESTRTDAHGIMTPAPTEEPGSIEPEFEPNAALETAIHAGNQR